MSFSVQPLCDALGVKIEDFDFSAQWADDERRELQDLWLQHGLLLVRGRNANPENQIRFSKLFGELEAHPLKTIRSGDYPELMELNSEDSRTNPVSVWDGEEWVGRLPWHKDLVYTAKPNRGAILRAVRLPAEDGQTGYADQAKAYEALSDAMKAKIEGLKVIYRFEVNLNKMPFLDTSTYVAGPGAPQKPSDVGFPDFPDSRYPLVLEHPETGQKILNVCPMFVERIDGVSKTESDALLTELVAHVTRPEFAYLHPWQEGDMILWDNWRYMHSAPGVKPGAKRLIHRTTILGDSVLGEPMPLNTETRAS
ncbi:taurine dioxygenase [Litorivivens lipolytica]|uniref:Taurine dioxygenase n=1 Tax=Litorivivens lipolytica TaxID=1524264 RepID=A0A7W4W3W3_9GAMM|nr:TauD/TfdA family dioxygenase [Litorivivens lipolytica]MBB3046929.1 taurine dioxygenase [Litorivivens lipolytica]